MNDTFQGTSLRDQFAMSALIGILSNSTPHDVLLNPEHVAENAYYIADAMLKERGKSTASRYGKKRQQ